MVSSAMMYVYVHVYTARVLAYLCHIMLQESACCPIPNPCSSSKHANDASSAVTNILHVAQYPRCPLSPICCLSLPLQGHHGRSRVISRTVQITPSSAGSTHAHLNGHAEPDSKHSTPSSVVYKKRLQPIGADAKPKVSESSRINGLAKRTSLVMDGTTSLKSSQAVLSMSIRQGSHDSKRSDHSTSSSTADQAPIDQQFLPPIV